MTHRCHDRQFLLRFAKDRDNYRRRLREAVQELEASRLYLGMSEVHRTQHGAVRGGGPSGPVGLVGLRRTDGMAEKNRLLEVDKLLWLVRCGSLTEFRRHFNAALEEVLVNEKLQRQAKWTEAIAVGERAYVKAIEAQIRSRQQMLVGEEGRTWVLREEHKADSGAEKKAMSSYRVAFLS